jgi:hypothetical protein
VKNAPPPLPMNKVARLMIASSDISIFSKFRFYYCAFLDVGFTNKKESTAVDS